MQKELEACGITLEEFKSNLDCLRTILPYVVADIEKRTQLDILTVLFVLNRVQLHNKLSEISGYPKIIKSISNSNDPKSSLHQPHGDWFQLIVGNLLLSLGEEILFEQVLPESAAPKDIVFRKGTIIIECKSFEQSNKTKERVQNAFEGKKIKEISADAPEGFNKKLGLFPAFPWFLGDIDKHGIAWITNNDYLKFISGAIEEKYHQMIKRKCNIIACNVTSILESVTKPKQSIEDLLKNKKYDQISGILLISSEGISSDDHKKMGILRYQSFMIENPIAEVKIPPDFVKYFNS